MFEMCAALVGVAICFICEMLHVDLGALPWLSSEIAHLAESQTESQRNTSLT